MTACRSQEKSTSNPSIIAFINTARSHVTILCGYGGKVVEDNQPQKPRREGQVRLLDGSLRLGHPVSTLSINGQVQGHPHLGGLYQGWLTRELAIFDNLPPVVKLGGERGPVGINILAVWIPADGRQRDIKLNAMYSDMLQWVVFGGGSPPINM